MPVAADSQSTTLFELRNASLALLALVLRTGDLGQLERALEERFGATPALFEHDPVVIDLSPIGADRADLDFAALQALLRARRMLPVAVTGGNAAQMQAALAAGLSESSTLTPARTDVAAPDAPHGAGPGEVAPAEVASADNTPAGTSRSETASPETARQSAAPAGAPIGVATMVIDRPLRSGQQVYARGGDLVVLAAVNFGAEVIADGNIHVYAPLRGRAIAGARGNTAARIFSTCMEPQLVAIAGTYRTSETPLPADVLGRPAQVWLDGDALLMQPLQPLKT